MKITLRDVELTVREAGEGHPVVLLHAFISGAATWDGFAAELAARGRRAIAVEQRGHGESARPGVYSMEALRDDVLGVLDRLGLERVDLVGHSMGGAVALLAAAHRPAAVRRLVIEDTPPLGGMPPAPPGEPEPTEPEHDLGFDWRMITPILDAFRTPSPGFADVLTRVQAPTLLLWGGATSHVTQEHIELMAGAIPDCRVAEIPVGHRIHSLAPSAFAAEVLPFLCGG
ncbi:alpha/beta fold hydrolase [Nonomuraea fuscirosea]|uniref:alpha/beta fold hydrolase n=1 Tax=Nonomuraea fuscirosea TaxID=1291556 RepID=UPI0033D913B0